MFVKNLENCREIAANDGCCLRELLHPGNDSVKLPYSVAVASVEKYQSTYKHQLLQTEVYYILSGSGRMHINNEVRAITQGDVILIPPGAVQWLENDGHSEIRFLVIVSPPWTEEGDVRTE